MVRVIAAVTWQGPYDADKLPHHRLLQRGGGGRGPERAEVPSSRVRAAFHHVEKLRPRRVGPRPSGLSSIQSSHRVYWNWAAVGRPFFCQPVAAVVGTTIA